VLFFCFKIWNNYINTGNVSRNGELVIVFPDKIHNNVHSIFFSAEFEC